MWNASLWSEKSKAFKSKSKEQEFVNLYIFKGNVKWGLKECEYIWLAGGELVEQDRRSVMIRFELVAAGHICTRRIFMKTTVSRWEHKRAAECSGKQRRLSGFMARARSLIAAYPLQLQTAAEFVTICAAQQDKRPHSRKNKYILYSCVQGSNWINNPLI